MLFSLTLSHKHISGQYYWNLWTLCLVHSVFLFLAVRNQN